MTLSPFDQDYLRRLQENDPEVTSHFFAHFSRLLRNKLHARRLPENVVEDLMQETFRRTLLTVRTGRVQDGFRLGAFVSRTCSNVMYEYYRSASRGWNGDDSSGGGSSLA